MHSEAPQTIDDWLRAAVEGSAAGALLEARRAEIAGGAGAGQRWITLVSPAQLAARIDAIESRAAAHRDRESALAAMPLFGVPFAVKDNIDVAGLPTTAGCPAFASMPSRDASAVARLLDAGAVCLGKTNLDQFATGLVGTRSPYGRPASACAADRISGGSSSGSAVVVARGDVPFALGTDTAGSGRVPAAFNNVVGLKPTQGRVGCSGVVPACRSLDCVSVFALTVGDAARVLALIEGLDAADPYSDVRTGAAHLAPRLRIGVPRAPAFFGDAGDAAAFERALATVCELGHMPVPLDFAPLHAVGDLLYGGPWVAERHAVVQPLLDRDAALLDPVVREVIAAARAFSATDAFRAQYRLRSARRDCDALWRDVDLLMVPSAPGHPTHAEVDADPIGVNARLGTYTNFVNLLGWCALALPASIDERGLPFGITFIAPGASDAALARLGHGWQRHLGLPLGATGRRMPPTSPTSPTSPASPTSPTGWPASEPTLPIAVVGAHLAGLPLNAQLVERGAALREATRTAPHYRLYALPDAVPPKPGLVRVADGGAAIDCEVWELPLAAVGSFLALVPPPLGIGSVELHGGHWVHGFICEAHALDRARDVTSHGGWRHWLAAQGASNGPS